MKIYSISFVNHKERNNPNWCTIVRKHYVEHFSELALSDRVILLLTAALASCLFIKLTETSIRPNPNGYIYTYIFILITPEKSNEVIPWINFFPCFNATCFDVSLPSVTPLPIRNSAHKITVRKNTPTSELLHGASFSYLCSNLTA